MRSVVFPTPVRCFAVLTALIALVVGCAPAASPQENVVLSPACSSPDRVVSVPDRALAIAIRGAVDQDAGSPLTCETLAGVDTLAARDVGSLEGLQFANNLTRLTLSESRLTSLAPLAGLERLTTLIIRGGNLTDVDPLADLPRLSRLEISDNALRDIEGLAGAPRLSFVTLHGNSLSDISALSQVEELYWLDLTENEIEDISPLAANERLRILKLNDNHVSDASPLAGLPQLGWVELARNELEDMEFIARLRIELLDLSGNRIRAIAPLALSLGLRDDGNFDLRHNCIDLSSGDPFLEDLLSRSLNVDLEPQAECAKGAE